MEENKYFIQLICDNCESYQGGYIQKGIPVKTYLLSTECKKCGCKNLRKTTLEEARFY